jgi:hypothetical protein
VGHLGRVVVVVVVEPEEEEEEVEPEAPGVMVAGMV